MSIPTHAPEIGRAKAEEPYLYEQKIFVEGMRGRKPALPLEPSKWEQMAQETLSAASWGYVSGNAGSGETDRKNKNAFQKWSIIPSRLVETKYPDLRTKVLGEELDFPVAIAPIGVQKIFHNDAETAVAKVTEKLRIPYVLSSATCTSFEDVAKANGGGKRWYQLYWPANKDNDLTISLLNRAKKAGYTALVVTIDTYAMGWRYVDMDHGFNPFLGADKVGVELGFSDPLFQKRFKEEHGKKISEDMATAAAQWAGICTPGTSHTWDDLKFLKAHWDGPIVLKGIQSITDAKKAVEYGMQGIVVSNHGGRQQDGVPGSLDSLPGIVKTVGDKLEVMFDSGVRSGIDIAKALALGARCVLVGRPYIWGLAIDGEAGVEHVWRSLLGELQMTLHQADIGSVKADDLNETRLMRDG